MTIIFVTWVTESAYQPKLEFSKNNSVNPFFSFLYFLILPMVILLPMVKCGANEPHTPQHGKHKNEQMPYLQETNSGQSFNYCFVITC